MSLLYVVGQVYSCQGCKRSWELQGVFTSEEKAVEACKTRNYFVNPIEADYEAPHESVGMPDSYFPVYDAEQREEKE